MNSTSLKLKLPKANAKVLPLWQTKITLSTATKVKIGVFLLVIGVLSLGFWGVARAYQGKILPKVMIANIKVGGKTPEEAKALVRSYVEQINAQGPTLSYEDKTIPSKLSDMGVTFNVDQVVNDAYRYGRSGKWTTRLGDNSRSAWKYQTISLNPQIDNGKFDAFLGQIATVVEKAPVNAGLNINSGVVSQTASEKGRGLDKNKLKNDLTGLINTNKLAGSKIALATSDLTPDVVESGTLQAKTQAEEYIASAPIAVQYNDQTFTADKAAVGSWINFSVSGHALAANISTDNIGGWVNKYVAPHVEVKENDKVVMEGTDQVLEEGNDGIGMDHSRLVNDLKSRVAASQPGSAIAVATFLIPKNTTIKNPHAQPCRYSGYYVDVNLSEQTLYAFNGCTLLYQFLVSTGKTGPTPTGEFHVYSLSRVTTMDGPGYSLPGVEWVSWFSGDYSIHGTYWHHNFGHPMSHGCVNASNEDAQRVYQDGGVGTPVYIHW